ncbi:hypothetical protein [Actinoplanes sp. TFC3]|uniref:hypothetical protein n=1 Tax=Actinoplanes sp. TFC3 TaxID=1710355 RepID=UPI00082960D7|nr:hypothetical protein [Actinoplanes sp. TFC3]
MTDDELDRLVRAADPYRPGVLTRLEGAEQDLLEEIVRVRRVRFGRTAAILSAAAAITAVLAVPAVLTTHRSDTPVQAVASPAFDLKSKTKLLDTGTTTVLLLLRASGWKVTSVYGFTGLDGTIEFAKGDLSLDISWNAAEYYPSFYDDRLEVSPPAPGKVDGWAGDVFTYSDSDWELMLRPRGDVFAMLRTSGPWQRAEFDAVLAGLSRVTPSKFVAAMPPEVVTPDTVAEAASGVLTGVPLPPGVSASTLDIGGINDSYHFAANVIGRVGCGWLDEWTQAKKLGDAPAAARVVSVLGGSRQWPALTRMASAGDFPQVFWEKADRLADGEPPGDYRREFSCS